MRYIDNLFGTIAGFNSMFNTGMDFIPSDGNGQVINISGDDASWIGMKSRLNQRYAYDFCYPLSSVIDRLAEFDINGEFEILKLTGKGKEDYLESNYAKRIKKLFSRPNPLQTWEVFRAEQLVYKRIFGFCPVMPVVPVGFSPENATAMFNINPVDFEPIYEHNRIFTSNVDDIVGGYRITGTEIVLQPKELFILVDSFVRDEHGILPQSRLVGLDMAISNICAAMEADNVLLKKRGPLGFISHDAAAVKDSVAGYVPMGKGEKQDLQNELMSYGLSRAKAQYVISKTAVKWNPISFDTKQLGTKETVSANEGAICHRYGYPEVLYKESDSTFANGNSAGKSVYQNTVIPNSKKDFAVYSEFFQAAKNDAKFCYDFDLPILKEDEKASAEAAKSLNEALEIEYKNGIITKNQWLTARGYDTISGGDVYYSENIPSIV